MGAKPSLDDEEKTPEAGPLAQDEGVGVDRD